MEIKNWYALYTRPRYEKRTAVELKHLGIEFYLPLVKTLRVWSDRKKWVEIPLFSSYLFIKTEEGELYKALAFYGAVRIVSFEGKPVVIPEKQIDEIKMILSSEIKAEPVDVKIPAGSKVEIIRGPLIGIIAEMVQYNNKHKIIIRMNQLEKSFEIQIPRNHVRIIN